MIKFFTMEFTSPVKAVPIIIPTAKSSILPLKANFLNSIKKFFIMIKTFLSIMYIIITYKGEY